MILWRPALPRPPPGPTHKYMTTEQKTQLKHFQSESTIEPMPTRDYISKQDVIASTPTGMRTKIGRPTLLASAKCSTNKLQTCSMGETIIASFLTGLQALFSWGRESYYGRLTQRTI